MLYFIRVHALAGAKCFSDLLGVYALRSYSSEMLPCGEKKRKSSKNVDNIIHSSILRHVPSLASALRCNGEMITRSQARTLGWE